MADSKAPKSWVFTPGQDFASGGALCLGQVLENWRDPASALIPKAVAAIALDVYRNNVTKEAVSVGLNSTLSKSFAAYVEAKGLPISVNAETSRTNSDEALWHFDSLESETF